MKATVFTACLRGVTILRTYFLKFLYQLYSPYSNKRGLKQAIALVDEWMNEESEYDEQTHPQIEAALNQS